MKWNLIYFHRIGNWAFRKRIPLIPLLIKFLIRLLFNSSVEPSMTIGEGTTFAYGGIGVVINKKAIIGKYVMIGQGITIEGKEGSGKNSTTGGKLIIEDGVYIAAGARILGAISIGEGAVIGANAVVTKDVPANAIVAGVPAKIIRYKSENEYNTKSIMKIK